MSKNREIEAKTIITKETFQRLSKAFPHKADFKQANYYFDTPKQLLKNNKISMRIRIFDDHAEQTLKVPDKNPIQKNFHEVIEINDDLEHDQAISMVNHAQKQEEVHFEGNVDQYLSTNFRSEKAQIRLFTWSKTHRILANGPQNCELTLDKTSYPDGFSDYELEIENTDPKLIQMVLQKLEGQFNFKQTASNRNQSKIARASAHRN